MPRLLLALLALLVLAAPASAQSPRVINGQNAGPDDYPWTVALVQAGSRAIATQFCGGTLVTPTTVVTAAHCVEGATADEIEVLAGVRTLSAATEANYYPVESIAVAPGVTFPNPTLEADVATLELSDPVAGAEPIQVIGVGGTIEPALQVAGWGEITKGDDPSGPIYANVLQWADLDLVSDTDCATAWPDDFDVTTMFCALKVLPPPDDLADACNGDSGGPLMNIGPDETDPAGWELAGVVSWGSEECDDPNLPGVYARLNDLALRTFVGNAMDGNPLNGPTPQPEHVGGTPLIFGTPVPGQTLTCSAGSVDFDGGLAGDPLQVALNVVRVNDLAVVGGTTYALTSGDAGRRFACRARATLQTGGGSAVAYSAATDTVRAPTTVEVPGPAVPGPVQTVPGPIVQVPTPRVNDTTGPKIRKVSRRCTTSRRCTFTVTTSDAAPSSGVTALSAAATTIRARTCRKKGRRTVCASVTSRELTVRRTANGSFTVTTPKALPRGTHTLVLVAADGNGNVQAKPHRSSFTVR